MGYLEKCLLSPAEHIHYVCASVLNNHKHLLFYDTLLLSGWSLLVLMCM